VNTHLRDGMVAINQTISLEDKVFRNGSATALVKD